MSSLAPTISILVAVGTFLCTFIYKMRSDRLQRTLEFLRAIYEEDGPIREANLESAMWLRSNPTFAEAELPEHREKSLIAILDYYDIVADSAARGIVDSEMIVVHLGAKMRSMYQRSEGYIERLRTQLARPGIYQPLEHFVRNVVRDREV